MPRSPFGRWYTLHYDHPYPSYIQYRPVWKRVTRSRCLSLWNNFVGLFILFLIHWYITLIKQCSDIQSLSSANSSLALYSLWLFWNSYRWLVERDFMNIAWFTECCLFFLSILRSPQLNLIMFMCQCSSLLPRPATYRISGRYSFWWFGLNAKQNHRSSVIGPAMTNYVAV